MNHPLKVGTRVLAIYHGCSTCAPNHIDKIQTRIREVNAQEDGTYTYTLLDGRKVNEEDILEVR